MLQSSPPSTLLPVGKTLTTVSALVHALVDLLFGLFSIVCDMARPCVELVAENALLHPRRRMAPEILAPLVAYVGEVMRLTLKGRWATVERVLGGSMPVVITPEGRILHPLDVAYRELGPDPVSALLD